MSIIGVQVSGAITSDFLVPVGKVGLPMRPPATNLAIVPKSKRRRRKLGRR